MSAPADAPSRSDDVPPPRQPAADASRALVPVAAAAATLLLACVDAVVIGGGAEPALARPRAAPAPTATTSADLPATLVPETPAPAYPACIRVRLARVETGRTFGFAVEGPYRIVAGALKDLAVPRGPLLAQGDRLGAADARSLVTAIKINGQVLDQREVTVLPETSGTLKVDGRGYRGALVLQVVDGGPLSAVNLVDLEDYVCGVLTAEMPRRFDVEARRAQAVASRTYALYHAMRGRDLRDDQGSQVYRGTLDEDDAARRIVASTLGEVLTADGIPFEAFFHSTCGGSTSSAAEVFGTSAPRPLKAAVACTGCRHAPNYRWSRTLDAARLAALYHGLLGAGATVRTGSKDASGRSLTLEVLSPDGQVLDRVPADRLRNDYNQGLPLARQILSTSIEVQADGRTIAGRGFGHGVGLCQYGADGLARAGHDYRAILAHYYPTSQVTRIYD